MLSVIEGFAGRSSNLCFEDEDGVVKWRERIAGSRHWSMGITWTGADAFQRLVNDYRSYRPGALHRGNERTGPGSSVNGSTSIVRQLF
jgi:hypothetical protein